MASQSTLPFDPTNEYTLADFYSAGNETLYRSIYRAAIGRGERFIYFWAGISGCGRTHLLQAACYEASKLGLRPFYLSFKEPEKLSPAVLDNLENLHLICIDDLENIVQKNEWENAFFDFFNRLWDAGKRLITAGNDLPSRMEFQLKDLKSRLSSGVIFHLNELSDDEKIKALLFRSKQQGFDIPHEALKFLFNHCPRDTHHLFAILDQLSKASLKAKRRITIPFIKEVILQEQS